MQKYWERRLKREKLSIDRGANRAKLTYIDPAIIDLYWSGSDTPEEILIAVEAIEIAIQAEKYAVPAEQYAIEAEKRSS